MRDFNMFDGLFSSLTFAANQDMNGIEISNVTFQGTLGTSADISPQAITDLSYPIGDNLLQSNDGAVFEGTTSYTKKRQMTLTRNAQLRVKFDLRSTNNVDTAYAKVYINGVAVGTERSTTSDVTTTYSEDFSNVKDSDTLEIWAKVSNVATLAEITNFRVYIASDLLPSLTNDI